MTVFEEYAQYYELLYQDKDYEAETKYITRLLHRFAPKAKDILEFGSGTGIHGRLLAQNGYQVLGIERSEAMITQAKREENAIPQKGGAGKFDCVAGDICKINLQRTFDAVISLFHVISYQTSNEMVASAFQNAYLHLNPGGIFVFDVWYTAAVLGQRPELRVKQIDNDDIRLIRIADPVMRFNENIVDVNYTILAEERSTHDLTRIEETHSMRHFSLPEIELLSEMIGFSILHSKEFLTGSPPSEDTWGVCFVLEKT